MKTNLAFAEKWISDLSSNGKNSQKNQGILKSKTKSGNQKTEFVNLTTILQDLIDAGKKGNLCIDIQSSDFEKEIKMELEKLPSGSLIQEGSLLYFQKTWQAKRDLEEGFRKLIAYTKSYREKITNRYNDKEINDSIERIEKRWNDKQVEKGEFNSEKIFLLNSEQKKAIREAVSSPFHIITGGPGTGKTTVVAFLMEVLHALGELPDTEDIAIAAPTGRAGQRLTESIQFSWENMVSGIPDSKDIKGTTIHRFLKFQSHTQKFTYNKDRSFLHRLVIVDEVSMVDIFIFQSLLQAFPNLEVNHEIMPFRFILLGDPNQLPSVEKGAVFRDILQEIEKRCENEPEFGSIILTELVKSNRHNSDEGHKILSLANSILNDETSKANQGVSPNLSEFWKDFDIEIPEKEPELSTIQKHFKIRERACDYLWDNVFKSQIKNITDKNLTNNSKIGYSGVLPDDRTFSDWATQTKCLTLYRRGIFGIEGLQSLIDKKARNYLNGGDTKKIPRIILNNRLYYPGLPIIITKNDSIRKLFNGDIGFVLLDASELRACFSIDGQLRAFALDTLPEHEEAYFLTVHKSQGSEYENLFFYIPPVRGKGKANATDHSDIGDNDTKDLGDEDSEDNGLANKQILYTGITRAKKTLVIFGSKEGWEEASRTQQERLTGFRL